MKLSEYKLVKIKYTQSIKQFNSLFNSIDESDINWIKILLDEVISTSTHKRNNIADWLWIKGVDLDRYIEILNKYNFNYKLIDQTETYYKTPEKLASLRNEIDNHLNTYLDIDFILDRISEVGIDNITKLEKKFLYNNSSTFNE